MAAPNQGNGEDQKQYFNGIHDRNFQSMLLNQIIQNNGTAAAPAQTGLSHPQPDMRTVPQRSADAGIVPSSNTEASSTVNTQKQKRRSKNDNEGRNFRCGCGKMYLSYPALYTHIKTKHEGKSPEGTNAPQLQNGRGRGRPKKVDPSTSEIKRHCSNQPNPTEKTFFEEMGVSGGPSNPLEGFDSYSEGYQTSPIFTKLAEIVRTNVTPDSTSNVKCDEAMAYYLFEASRLVVQQYYKNVILFTCYFRDSLNQLGWEILKSHGKIGEIPEDREFSAENNAEHAPEICNEFITDFLPNTAPEFDRTVAIQLTRHFCHWLYTKNYTYSKISLMQEPDGRTLTCLGGSRQSMKVTIDK